MSLAKRKHPDFPEAIRDGKVIAGVYLTTESEWREHVSEKMLIMLMGLPRAGKSMWARASGVPVVNPDSIRLAMHEQPYIKAAEPFVWAIAKTMVKALFLAGHDKVVLDATNTTRKRRDEWRDGDWAVRVHEFTASIDLCIQRAKSSNRDDLIPVIERMFENYEPLDDDEERL